MPESVTCNLCGADDTRLLYGARDYRLRVDDELWNLVECRRCSLGYLNPRPTVDEIGRYYPEVYFARRTSMARRYALQASYVTGAPGDLLEIGSAGGDFLALMRDKGWRVTGIEPSSAANTYGLPILKQRFPEECELEPETFDVVAAWAVFEHLHNPGGAFERAAILLRPGGRLIVQVPNLRSINSRYARLEDIPRHLYFFTPSTIHQYARQCGLAPVETLHTTDLFGGSAGRGVLRRLLVRAIGGDDDDFFAFYRLSRRARFRRSPALASAWMITALIERILITDWLTRTLKISGQIVAVLEKPVTGGPNTRTSPSNA